MDMTKELKSYLKGTASSMDEAPEGEVVIEAAEAAAPIMGMLAMAAGAEDPDEPMKMLLAKICVISWLSKDFHYRAKGDAFYGNHLLADLVADGLCDKADRLREVYYMGEKKMPPPCEVDTARMACRLVDNMPCRPDTDVAFLVRHLLVFVESASREVERIKDSMPLMSGTTAVLDDISADLLQKAGLLHRVVEGDGSHGDEAKAEEVTVIAIPEETADAES